MSHKLSSLTDTFIIIVGILALILLAVTLGTRYAKRKGYSHLGENTVVRCSKGHFFTTVWIPGISFKAIRLGMKRYQRCPICEQWRIIVPVKDSELTDELRRVASEHHDSRQP